MGLLSYIQQLDEETEIQRASHAVDNVEAVLDRFAYNTRHLDYPWGVFSSFQSVIGFSKGALLLPDCSSGIYYLWASTGFDRTTSRRLRVPVDFPVLRDAVAGSAIILHSEDMERMLSNRVNELINNLTMIVIGGGERHAAILLAADCLKEDAVPDEIQRAIGLLNEKLGAGIGACRHIIPNSVESDYVDLPIWLQSWGKQEGILILIDLKPAIELLLTAAPGIEPYCARADMVNFLRHVNGRMGRFHDLEDGRVLLMLPPRRLPDRKLYLHQLAASLSSAFLNLAEIPSFPAAFRKWPEEEATIKEHFSGFF